MRISIRAQLGLLILLSSLIGLAVVSVATWVSNHNFVLSIRSSRLSLTAALKAAQLASNLNLMQTSANFITTRVLIQSALQRYNEGNNSESNWIRASGDMSDAVSGGSSVGQSLLLQSRVFPPDGSQGTIASLLNTSSSSMNNTIRLPYNCPDGKPVYLGDGNCGDLDLGYPPQLYPNLTYITEYYNSTTNIPEAKYGGQTLGPSSTMLMGPLILNDSSSLVSMTMPIVNNTSATDILGWITVVMDGSLIQSVLSSNEGLENTGETLLIGPAATSNMFPGGFLYNSNDGSDFKVQYVYPLNPSDKTRHPDHVYGTTNAPFSAGEYPVVVSAFTHQTGQSDNSGAMLKAKNENGQKVSVGYALPQQEIVNWAIIVEQSRGEVWQPINRLRDILLACVFATAALMAIIAFPLAHVFSLPIRRLREATRRSMEPPNATLSRSSLDSLRSGMAGLRDGANGEVVESGADAAAADAALARKEGFSNPVSNWRKRQVEEKERRREARRKRVFKIPGKVKERKTCIKDELTDLTSTFNEMSDELMMQYERLEDRVQQRTAELELSKKAAEAANESKTLFIANISHELKTPLNGILGMCAVCMQEDDPMRLKRSLGIIYKSGDLLLNLLTDLLTFSKNQVGQHLTLDDKEFKLREVSSQLLAIFDKQAREGGIGLKVLFEGVGGVEGEGEVHGHDEMHVEKKEFGPAGTGRVKNMILWGDIHRILQVVINLVSNALKFTPSGGSVIVTIRCLPELPDLGSRKGSLNSRQSRQRSSRHKGSDASLAISTANAINAKDKPYGMAHATNHERAPSPPPGRFLNFEFEVTDTGPGIPENLLDKIFEPFVQGDLGLSKKYGGTGLGLSICTQLASLMRGSMGVQSEVGEGSTFWMQIPIRHIQSRADSTASSAVDLTDTARRSEDADGLSHTHTPRDRRSRHLADEHDGTALKNHTATTTDPATASTNGTSNPGAPVTNESQPRLVGFSQPFFAASQPMESPGSQPAAMEKMTAEATRGGRIRVLVAEDNKVNQEVVLRMLKLEDIYDVTVAKDGQEALDRVRESMAASEGDGSTGVQPYNLIFMDVQMPNVDGLTSTRLIREIGYQAPIVALTAFAEESNIKDCYDSGMNYFLSKPIRRPQLKKVLKEYCAPIPEENEDTPPEVAAQRASVAGGQNTTIVMVQAPSSNGGGRMDGGSDEKEKLASPAAVVNGTSTHTNAALESPLESTEPVSPFSTS
ncbi:Histidine kinase osmosensor [Recurvomyces mirabilis]|uniref:histidine kinase n=1 Tax=Recurvomyces mirabilis TaxID=574656 RepID=A0AAE0WJC0_9PEZI|nr:Histidine kinase osmosensor [Recurvomyces mirabilis]KAK5155051.1 Histidine kinase osmosensor [Recurvomyces mirabilis]